MGEQEAWEAFEGQLQRATDLHGRRLRALRLHRRLHAQVALRHQPPQPLPVPNSPISTPIRISQDSTFFSFSASLIPP